MTKISSRLLVKEEVLNIYLGNDLGHGELLRPLIIEDIKKDEYVPETRNKIIAGVFNNLGIMDKRGTGVLRMNKFCDEWNLPHPEYKEQTGYFGIIFRNPDYYTRVPEIKISAELNERQKKAIEYLKENRKITSREYRRLFDIVKDTAHRDLVDLISKRLIIKKGIGKNIYYILESDANRTQSR